MKALKLPPLNEDKDDLDAYLIGLERACIAFEGYQEHMQVYTVCQVITGQNPGSLSTARR